MTRKERCELAISRGYTYNQETGIIYSRLNKIVKSKTLGYIMIGLTVNKKTYLIRGHQFAWYYMYKECVEQIDHINGIRDDNRICNLRSVTNQQNQWNRKTAKGYSWCKRDSNWKANIKLNKKDYYLGNYNTEQEARNAYLEAKQKYHVI